VTDVLRTIALGTAWLACALVIALGSAGLVAGLSSPPGSSARAELTWAADQAIEPGLAAARSDLVALAADVDRLGLQGRAALAAILARDPALLDSTIAEGSGLIASIEDRSSAIGGRLGALPGAGAGMAGRFGPDVVATYEGIGRALATTTGLDDSWATLTAGSAAAMRLVDLLQQHDVDAAEAARLGSRGSYGQALDRLAPATAALDRAADLRDRLQNTSDVSVLDQWIARNRALDTTLRRLYTALRDSKGTVTPAVREAAAAEQAAQKDLPPDTRALVVIMADLARGGLNQAVIAIEQTKGDLAAALARLPAPGR
jgi:hypothetical protein